MSSEKGKYYVMVLSVFVVVCFGPINIELDFFLMILCFIPKTLLLLSEAKTRHRNNFDPIIQVSLDLVI